MAQFGLVRSLRMCNDKSYYVEFDTAYSAEQAVKSTSLSIEDQQVHCSFLITPPGLELPIGSSFSRKGTTTNSTVMILRPNLIRLENTHKVTSLYNVFLY